MYSQQGLEYFLLLYYTISTVAEKDTAAAAKAAVGRPKAAVGRQRAAHRLRLTAVAQPRPPICSKIDSLAYN